MIMKMTLRNIFLFLFSVCCITLDAAGKKTDCIDEAAALRHALVSYKMVNLRTGEVVAEENSQTCATPASITKLITTATAFELLGGNFTFKTTIEFVGTLDNGVLDGDIVVRGGADPTLGSIFLGDRNFVAFFAQRIKDYGIKHVTGDIVACTKSLNRCPVPLKWAWEDMGTHYGAGCFALSAYDNTTIITLKSGSPGTRPDILSIWPDNDNMRTVNEIETLVIPNDSIFVFSAPFMNMRYLQGGMPANRNNYVVKANITNPPLLVASSLKKELTGRGVPVDGEPIVDKNIDYSLGEVIYTNTSRSLSNIARVTNFKSNNMYAEHIFRRLGNMIAPNNATIDDAVAVIRKYWSGKGIDMSALFMHDGCGLAPQNAFSADLLTAILVEMRTSKNWTDFKNSIPCAGKEGTVAGFLRKTPLEGRAWVKSGSISGVQCYSGYIVGNSGEEYAFTFMVNNYSCSRSEVKRIIENRLVRDAK